MSFEKRSTAVLRTARRAPARTRERFKGRLRSLDSGTAWLSVRILIR
ncbi:MAG: hypothetical protein Ct9H300mP30_5220 [Methanobacteriota archaeon]|nr:MAG: hypothetical protein Ct9H300mP30_5220 [Euryarchaeota archaeon]